MYMFCRSITLSLLLLRLLTLSALGCRVTVVVCVCVCVCVRFDFPYSHEKLQIASELQMINIKRGIFHAPFYKATEFHCVCELLHSTHTYLSSLDVDLVYVMFIHVKKVCPLCSAVFSVRKLCFRLLG